MMMFWFRYFNDALLQPGSESALLVLCHDVVRDANGEVTTRFLLSFDGGDWHEDGWRVEFGGRHMVLSFNAGGPSRPRHRVRLQASYLFRGMVSFVGYDYRHCFMIYLIFRISKTLVALIFYMFYYYKYYYPF